MREEGGEEELEKRLVLVVDGDVEVVEREGRGTADSWRGGREGEGGWLWEERGKVEGKVLNLVEGEEVIGSRWCL